ncbi:MAG: hypothetical protein LKH78_01965 [Weizmannia coagulans]|nr:hypothetical protein [Heyndrickxia coagulans]
MLPFAKSPHASSAAGGILQTAFTALLLSSFFIIIYLPMLHHPSGGPFMGNPAPILKNIFRKLLSLFKSMRDLWYSSVKEEICKVFESFQGCFSYKTYGRINQDRDQGCRL